MRENTRREATGLVRALIVLQLKLLLAAGRDLVLIPVVLAACLADFFQVKTREPRYFRRVLRLGERSDEWIDIWSAGREADAAGRENVDALLARVEEAVRDPQSGARRARILKRWAERQITRARRRPPLAGSDPGAPSTPE